MFVVDKEFPSSKSLANRALILQSYFPELRLQFSSQAEDVTDLQSALAKLPHIRHGDSSVIAVRDGGTTFRFLALRLSRLPGHHEIRVGERLASRPHEELVQVLGQLGVRAWWEGQSFHVESAGGWQEPASSLLVPGERSSQFASSLLLNSWNLPFDLEFVLPAQLTSQSYWQMTLRLCEQLGGRVERAGWRYVVGRQSRLTAKAYCCEPDMSSIFTVAALAVINGDLRVRNFPAASLQPDAVFLEIFRAMGIQFELSGSGDTDTDNSAETGGAEIDGDWEKSCFHLARQNPLRGVDLDLAEAPDLFPVLASMLACFGLRSRLYGARQLVHKESNRLQALFQLFDLMGVAYQPLDDGVQILGDEATVRPSVQCVAQEKSQPAAVGEVVYDPDRDHRMAFAAACFQMHGRSLRLLHPEVVRKSFPEFFSWLQQTSGC